MATGKLNISSVKGPLIKSLLLPSLSLGQRVFSDNFQCLYFRMSLCDGKLHTCNILLDVVNLGHFALQAG